MGTAIVLAAALLVAAGMAVRPLARTCAPSVRDDVCAETVSAALKRGLAPLHPLILGSHVEPGPAAGAARLGHKASVTFDLLGVPGPTTVRLFLDMGGHWGGEVDRSDAEIAAWAMAPLVLALGVAAGLVAVARGRRTAAARGRRTTA